MDYESIYKGAFDIDRYSRVMNALRYDHTLESLVEYKPKTVLDIGAGRGQIEKLAKEKELDIVFSVADLFNFTKIDDIEFFRIDLTRFRYQDIGKTFDCVICIDVLEHIEEKYIRNILSEICKLTNYVFFSVANHSNVEIINGEPVELHIIQEPIEYWEKLFLDYFNIKLKKEVIPNKSFYFECKVK